MKFFHVIRKQNKQATPKLDSLDMIKDYFTIEYIQENNDWYKMEFTQKRYPVKVCQETDFGDSEKAKEIYATWAGFILVCPDIDDPNALSFQNTAADMISRSVTVEFNMCQKNCADNMKNWLNDVQVDLMVLENRINYLDYVDRPTDLIQRRLSTNIFAEGLVAQVVPSQQMEIVKNEFFMEDDMFQIG